jgi:PAS domain S-box-containing protein
MSLGVERSSVLLFDEEGVMRFRAWRDLSDGYRRAVEGHSPWSPDTRDATPVLVEDIHSEPSVAHLVQTFEEEGVRALAFFPLAIGTRLLGKFMLYYPDVHQFTEQEVLFAETVGAHVAFAIDQQAHRETEARYRSLTGSLPALLVTTSAAGEIEDIDDNYRAYTGLTLAQAKDWATHQVIHPGDYDRSMQIWGAAIASGEPMQNEMRLRRHDGTYRWYLVEAQPVRDDAGNILRWVTVNIDIDERKRSEAHDRYLSDVTERLVAPIGSLDMLADIARLAVPTLADICAIGLFDDSSQTARVEIAVGDDHKRADVASVHLRGWRSAPGSSLTIGDITALGESVFVPDSSEAWIRACAPDDDQISAAMSVEPQSIICIPLRARGATIGMATFVTTRGRQYAQRDHLLLSEVATRLSIALENLRLYEDLRENAEELRRANSAKDEFLGLVSHELRTPLTSVRGNAEILVRSYGLIDDESRRRALQDIVAEGERLQRIIDNLLLLARMEQGYQLPDEPLLVIRVVEEVIARHRQLNPIRHFELKASNRARPVSFPIGYLDQVIENLVSNAEKYSPSDEPITIEVERDDKQVSVRVLDRGSGISAGDAAQLFEPFFRSTATQAKASGLGIGLAVCKRLIDAQGGSIWARPRSGGGTEFGFSLPVLDESIEDL